ncbi:uncharacterized protein A4U43_C01F18820 [Asparagus officinalis]|uniref:Uncharacterized protein n=1 Tax=Asparagus officinalis TaxID=4686 RepID=A0A5P1FQF1_ASPOF|nr:uncharacterized protein A4U43_C01F18820 [Asparagus officinalis]
MLHFLGTAARWWKQEGWALGVIANEEGGGRRSCFDRQTEEKIEGVRRPVRGRTAGPISVGGCLVVRGRRSSAGGSVGSLLSQELSRLGFFARFFRYFSVGVQRDMSSVGTCFRALRWRGRERGDWRLPAHAGRSGSPSRLRPVAKPARAKRLVGVEPAARPGVQASSLEREEDE